MEIKGNNKDLWNENKYKKFSKTTKNILLTLGYVILFLVSFILLVFF